MKFNASRPTRTSKLSGGQTMFRVDHYARVKELIDANNVEVERRRAAEKLLREAAELFRYYEKCHLGKIVPGDVALNHAAGAKALRNGEIAHRIEQLLKL